MSVTEGIAEARAVVPSLRAAARAAHKRLKEAVDAEIGRLHKTHALLIATQFAANHDCEFDVSDALAVIRDRVEESIGRLDRAQVSP